MQGVDPTLYEQPASLVGNHTVKTLVVDNIVYEEDVSSIAPLVYEEPSSTLSSVNKQQGIYSLVDSPNGTLVNISSQEYLLYLLFVGKR